MKIEDIEKHNGLFVVKVPQTKGDFSQRQLGNLRTSNVKVRKLTYISQRDQEIVYVGRKEKLMALSRYS